MEKCEFWGVFKPMFWMNIVFSRFIFGIRIQGVTRGNCGLQGVTVGYKGLQEVTRGYKGLHGVTKG